MPLAPVLVGVQNDVAGGLALAVRLVRRQLLLEISKAVHRGCGLERAGDGKVVGRRGLSTLLRMMPVFGGVSMALIHLFGAAPPVRRHW
jgi:hypothetical protein